MLFITAKKTPLIGKEIVNTNFITLYSYSMKMRFFGYNNNNNNNNNNYNGWAACKAKRIHVIKTSSLWSWNKYGQSLSNLPQRK